MFMKDKIELKRHTAALSAMFVLGDAVVFLPTANADEFTFAAFLVSGICLVSVFLIFSGFVGKVGKVRVEDSCLKKLLPVLFFVFSAVFACFCAASTFSSVVEFVSKTILPKTAKWLIASVFGGAVLYFALKKKENMLKFSLLGIVFVVGVVIFFVIAATDQYDVRNMYIFKIPSFRQLFRQIKPYILDPVLPTVILPIYFYFTFKETRTLIGTAGVVLGEVLLELCILSPVLLFGANLAGQLDFPFSSAVSTVTVGRLFTRLDGFAYFVCFICSLVKITVCLSVTFSCLKKISQLVDKSAKEQ